MTTKRGIQEKSGDTLIVENCLRKAEVGDVVTYAELTEALGRDFRKHSWYSSITARKSLMADRIVFDTVRGEGFKRLDDEGKTATLDGYVRKVRRTAKRGMKCAACVEFDKLSDESKRKHLTTSAQLGAIQLFGSSKATKRIAEKVGEGTSQLPVGETLKLFGG